MPIKRVFETEMEALAVNVPLKYKETLQEVAKEEKTSVSDIFRKVNGLITRGFNFDFSIHDKPLLNYAQTVSIIQYAMLEFIHEQMLFHANKNKNKSEFYEYLYKTTKIQYDFYDKSLLTMLNDGFDALSDDLSERLADRVETIAFMLEKGTNDEWNQLNNIAKKVIARSKKCKS